MHWYLDAEGQFVVTRNPIDTHKLGVKEIPSGFFAQAQGLFSAQSNWRFSPAEPGDAFWQANALLGYRLPGRRAELTVGILNLTDRDYRLEPLTLYQELPHRRTALVGLKFYF